MAAVGIGLGLQVATVLGPFTDFFQVETLTLDQWLLAIGAGVVPVVLLGLFENLRQHVGKDNQPFLDSAPVPG